MSEEGRGGEGRGGEGRGGAAVVNLRYTYNVIYIHYIQTWTDNTSVCLKAETIDVVKLISAISQCSL